MLELSARPAGFLIGLLSLIIAAGVAAAATRSSGDAPADVRIAPVQAADAGRAPSAGGASPGRPPAGAAPAANRPPPPPRSFFDEHQVLAYYGNPYSATMGILGEYEGDELVRRVKAQAARYQELNTEKKVIPALHLVYAVAQATPGPEGLYLLHMPDEMVEGFIELTRANGMLFFIDLQNGRADPVEEAAKVQRWMRHEHVHLAIDPEFTLAPGENTRDHIGQMDAATINRIQDLLQQTALEAGIMNKILMVHQFQPDMIIDKMSIAKDRDRVDVVINMDGWGGPEGKLSKWQAHIVNEPVEYAGIKLFYRWDKPLLTEAEVQGLTPRPNYIQYQ